MNQIEKLPEEKKGLILQMKCAKNTFQIKIGGYDIYKLVLGNKVNTVEDFISRYKLS